MQADRIYCGDALTVLKTLPDNSVNCCITSPPYYALRDYGVDGQIGRDFQVPPVNWMVVLPYCLKCP